MTEREHGRGEGREPLDEEAAWAQIVAGYGEEPADPPGWDKSSKGDKPATDEQAAEQTEQPDSQDERDDEPGGGLAVADPAPGSTGDQLEEASDGEAPAHDKKSESGTERTEGEGPDGGGSDEERPLDDADRPVRSFTVYAAGTGPRDFALTEPGEEDDHFVPPEPPPLPQLDPTAKFAWLAVLGGPALLFSAVIFQIEINWWMITLGIGGFLGGFGTLASRLKDGRDDEDGDPGRGAVV